MDITEILQNSENALIVARRDDLIAFAATVANNVLKEQPKPTPPKQETEQPISQAEASIFLGKSRQTLISWRKKGLIKAYHLGGRVYYKTSELLKALKEN